MYDHKLTNTGRDRGATTLNIDQLGGRRSVSKLKFLIGGACFGGILVLTCFPFRSLMRSISREQPEREVGPQAPPILASDQITDNISAILRSCPTSESPEIVLSTTQLTNLLLPRSNNEDAKAVANNQDETQTIMTDTDGTWVVVNTQDFTDSDGNTWIPATQEVSYSETTTTTWSTTVLTNLIIVSWRTSTERTTQDRFTTVTVTGKASAQDLSATTLEATIDPSTVTTTVDNPSTTTQVTDDSSRPSSELPSTTSALPDICPYSTCAPTCPWDTCSLKPTIMAPELCQMIDPCWSRKEKPPSQGNKCACLCESGYCNNKLKKCAELNCCHECGCYPDDPMSLQRGVGNC